MKTKRMTMGEVVRWLLIHTEKESVGSFDKKTLETKFFRVQLVEGLEGRPFYSHGLRASLSSADAAVGGSHISNSTAMG